MSEYPSTRVNVHGKPIRVVFWPKNGGSVGLEYTQSIAPIVDVTLYVGEALAIDIHQALRPVLRKHGIEVFVVDQDR